MRTILKVAALAVLMAAACGIGPALAQKRVALVIGIDQHDNLPAEHQLKKAGDDARAVGDALASLGFDVMRGRDLGRAAMRGLLADFTGRLNAGDTAVFYFAGHGVTFEGANYFVPADVPDMTGGSEAGLRAASIAEADVVETIRARRPRLTVFFVDAARDNPFPVNADGTTLGAASGLSLTRWPDDVFSIYSAGPGQVSLERLHTDDTHRHSLFARVLLEHLRHPRLTLNEVATGVRERVTELARVVGPDLDRPGPHEQTVTFAGGATAGQTRLGDVGAPRPPQTSPWPQTNNTLLPRSEWPPATVPPKIVQTVPVRPSGESAPSTATPARAVLYEEDAGDPLGRRAVGTARWRIERGSSQFDVIVHVDVEVPERGSKVSVSWKRNNDASLPASHLIEIRAVMHRPITNIPGMLMKPAEAARGLPLAGLSTPVTQGHFLFGLSAVTVDVERNLGLMKERAFFDIPIVFDDGKRAILAIEKGPAGTAAFDEALAAWSGVPAPPRPPVGTNTFAPGVLVAPGGSPWGTVPVPVPQQQAALPPVTTEPGDRRAFLYEEDPADPHGRRTPGSVSWRVDRGPEIVLYADVTVPGRGLALTVSFRKNTDRALPASHVIEIAVSASDPEVTNVPGVLMKPRESTRGVALAGLAVKVTPRHYIIGLSDTPADRTRNAELLAQRPWFDIPFVFSTGKRGIVAIEKGEAGEDAFRQAFAAWGPVENR